MDKTDRWWLLDRSHPNIGVDIVKVQINVILN